MKTVTTDFIDNIYCELKASMRELNIKNQTFEEANAKNHDDFTLAKLKGRTFEMIRYIGGIAETLRLLGFNVEFDIQSTKKRHSLLQKRDDFLGFLCAQKVHTSSAKPITT